MLSLWRRHESKCTHKHRGRAYIKCSCPIWCDGEIDGRRIRRSLGPRDWARAGRKLAALEDPHGLRIKPLAEAIAAFENHIISLQSSTQRKYRNVLMQLRDFCKGAGIQDVMQLNVEHLDAFRAGRQISLTTAMKE